MSSRFFEGRFRIRFSVCKPEKMSLTQLELFAQAPFLFEVVSSEDFHHSVSQNPRFDHPALGIGKPDFQGGFE